MDQLGSMGHSGDHRGLFGVLFLLHPLLLPPCAILLDESSWNYWPLQRSRDDGQSNIRPRRRHDLRRYLACHIADVPRPRSADADKAEDFSYATPGPWLDVSPLLRNHALVSLTGCYSTSVATIARLPEVHHLADADFTYANLTIAVWSIVETNIGIIATGLATFRPLLTKMGIMSSTLSSSQGHNRSYPMSRVNKGGVIEPNISEEDRLYDQYYPAAMRTNTLPQKPKPFRMGIGVSKDAIKVPSTAS
jgi:hypothetical protein